MVGQKFFVYGTQSTYWHHPQKLELLTRKNATDAATITQRRKAKATTLNDI